jgi:hypothetical protein
LLGIMKCRLWCDDCHEIILTDLYHGSGSAIYNPPDNLVSLSRARASLKTEGTVEHLKFH